MIRRAFARMKKWLGREKPPRGGGGPGGGPTSDSYNRAQIDIAAIHLGGSTGPTF